MTLNDLHAMNRTAEIYDAKDGRRIGSLAVTESKPSKYRNTKTEIDGRVFDSKREANRYLDLREEQKAGLIRDLKCQHEIPLMVNGVEVAKYVSDFCYVRNGKPVVEDVKSSFTKKLPLYRLKVKILAAMGIEVIET